MRSDYWDSSVSRSRPNKQTFPESDTSGGRPPSRSNEISARGNLILRAVFLVSRMISGSKDPNVTLVVVKGSRI